MKETILKHFRHNTKHGKTTLYMDAVLLACLLLLFFIVSANFLHNPPENTFRYIFDIAVLVAEIILIFMFTRYLVRYCQILPVRKEILEKEENSADFDIFAHLVMSRFIESIFAYNNLTSILYISNISKEDISYLNKRRPSYEIIWNALIDSNNTPVSAAIYDCTMEYIWAIQIDQPCSATVRFYDLNRRLYYSNTYDAEVLTYEEFQHLCKKCFFNSDSKPYYCDKTLSDFLFLS